MSRLVKDLTPDMQLKYAAFAVKMSEAGIPFMLTCTYRTQDEQKKLYAQGRTAPGPIVTKTLHSKHTEHKAFDIAILRNGKPIWDLKVDVNHDEIPDYEEAARIGRLVGLKAGADFGDYPHFELKETT